MMFFIMLHKIFNKKFLKKIFITIFSIIILFSNTVATANPLAIRAGSAVANALKSPAFRETAKSFAIAAGLSLYLTSDTTQNSNDKQKAFGRNCALDALVLSGLSMSQVLSYFDSYKDLKYLNTYRYEHSPYMMIDMYSVIGTKDGYERQWFIQCHNGGSSDTSDFENLNVDMTKADDFANEIVKSAMSGNSQAIELLKLAFSASNPTMSDTEINDLIEQLKKSAGATTGTQAGTGTQTGTQDGTKDEAKEKDKETSKDLDLSETNSKLDKLTGSISEILIWLKDLFNPKDLPEPEKIPPLVFKDPNINQNVDINKFNMGGTCPPDKQIQIIYGTLNFSYWSFCEFLVKISNFVVASGWIAGAYIVLGFGRR